MPGLTTATGLMLMAIKRVKKDYGLREHEVETYSPETPEESDRLIAALMNMKGPDEAREHNAKLVRDTLAEAGITDPHDTEIASKCGAEAFQVLAAKWLREYQALQVLRSKIEAGAIDQHDVMMLIHSAEELGKLQERIWWRHGVDPVTGAKRESLAVSERKSRQAIRKARPAIDAHNAGLKKKADQWKRTAQRIAEDIWKNNPALSANAVAVSVHRKWPKGDGAAKAVSTIRAVLKKPDRA